MNFFEKAKKDLCEFKDYDMYLSFFIALFVAIGNFFCIIDNKYISPIILTILSLIVISLLKNKFKLELLDSKILQRNVITSNYPDDFLSSIEEAETIDLIGIHHGSFINEHYNNITKSLECGGTVRVLLAKPDGDAIRMTSLRFAGEKPPFQQEQERSKASLGRFCELRNSFQSQVSIKTLDYLFEYGAIITDRGKSNCKIYVERYTFRNRGGRMKPKSVFVPSDGDWYQLYLEEYSKFWDCSLSEDVTTINS